MESNGRFGSAYCPTTADTLKIAEGFVRIGKQYEIEVKACAEIIDLSSVGVKAAKCIDPDIFECLIGYKVKEGKRRAQSRSGCNCMESIDIGTYDTCTNGCIYCYAKKGAKKAIGDNPSVEVYDRKTDLVFEYSEENMSVIYARRIRGLVKDTEYLPHEIIPDYFSVKA